VEFSSSLISAACLLGIVGLIAGHLPARRASALDPAKALRNA